MSRSKSKKPWYLQLHVQVGIALVLGFAVGVGVRLLEPSGFPSETVGEGIGVVGDIFLRLLKMIIIPLIFTSLVCGVASLGDARSVGRVGLRTVLFYTMSTTLAILVGLTLVNVFKPGRYLDIGSSASLPEGLSSTSQGLSTFLLHMVPDNVIRAMAEGDVLPVIFFAILFGLFLIRLNGPNVEAVHQLLEGALEVIQALTLAIVKFAPIGIFALLAREVVRSGPELIMKLLPYFATVGGGLLVHAFVTLPLILVLLARRNPLEYFRAVLPAVATAFSTASSSATLPLSMECAEKEGGIRRGVSSFVLPLGATVNMDGTALYEAVAALTIAQMYGVPLDLTQQALVLLTALLASVGAAGIPMAGLVMMIVVLEAVGLPIEGIATIIAVDRILDMMRTSTNVWSDLVGTAVINRLEGGETVRRSAVIVVGVVWVLGSLAAPAAAQSARTIAAIHTALVAEGITEVERQNGLLQQTWARVEAGAAAMVEAQRQGESLESLRTRADQQQQLESLLLMRLFEVQRARREVMTNLAVVEAAGGVGAADRGQEGILTGTWRLNVQPGLTGTAHLVQQGTLVSGTYELSGGWSGSFRGTLVADKVRLERIDSKLGFAAIFYGGIDRAPEGNLMIQGRWEASQLATGMPSAGGWNATLQD